MPNRNRKKAEFDAWIEDIIDDLNLKVGNLHFLSKNLKTFHWSKIWKIYDNCKLELLHTRNKEQEIVWETASHEAKLIILKAHKTNESKTFQEELMNHYINSSRYD
ncbi:hypothetical protein [Nostoc sp. CMAA1605]|uniref:hypothetical protein n=1 Tax=Nostoc sp. CMAA1605 TaxID=2055159 RepID=UPI001F39D181|nr:hypothetical protein [Nostoc sp. CMAA1605]MCF4968495.1 hypothetical protein [Nostoc sp. CMAA1605]